jgi:hypothetical protein
MEIFGTEVAHVAMGICHHNVCGSALKGSLNSSVDIAGHNLPKGVIGGHAAKNFLYLFHP